MTTSEFKHELSSRSDFDNVTVLTVRQEDLKYVRMWTLIANDDGTDILIDPQGRHVETLSPNLSSRARAVLDWLSNESNLV